MLMNFVSPAMIMHFFEGRLQEMLEAFAQSLECSIGELTIFFQANKQKELIARVVYQKKKIEDIPVLPVFEQMIKGVLAQVPESLLGLVKEFQEGYGKDLEEAFTHKKATNQAIVQLIKGGVLIVIYREGKFVYALKEKRGEKPKAVHLVECLTKENLDRIIAGLTEEK